MKKILIFLSLFIFLSSFINAGTITDLADSTILYHKYDLNADDSTINNNDGIVNGATLTTIGAGKINQSYNFITSNTDYISIADSSSFQWDSSSTFSVQSWVKFDKVGQVNGIATHRDLTNEGWFFRVSSDNRLDWITETTTGTTTSLSDCYSDSGTTTFEIDTWYFIVFTHNGYNDKKMYVNNVEVNCLAETSNIGNYHGTTVPLYVGADEDNSRYYFDGLIDEFALYDSSLNDEQRTYLFNGGIPTIEQQYPFNDTFLINNSVESTIVIKQTTPVTLLGPTPKTIISADFNLTQETPLYGGFSFEVLSTHNNNLFCEMLINDSIIGNVTRSNIGGILGNVFVMSELFNLTTNTYKIELVCYKTNAAGQITISNSIGIGHFMLNENNNLISSSELTLDETVNSGSAFTKIGEFNITTDNYNSTDQYNTIIIESAINYINNHNSDEILSTYITINNSFNCSNYLRYVISGNSGSVSMDCAYENATPNTFYTIEIYGNGTNSNYVSNLISKSFFLNGEEIAGGIGSLTGLTFSGSSDTKLFNLTGGNLHTSLANVFEKMSLSILTDDDTEVNLYVKLINGNNFTSRNFTRHFEGNKIGVLVGHDMFIDIPQDTYQIEVWANCGGSTCEIVGGASIGYLTDVKTVILNSFNITVYNDWDNSQILNFNVTDGAELSSNNGIIQFFTSNELINLTITSTDYINRTILNHNVSNNLNITIWQSEINLKVLQAQSYTPINNFSIIYNGSTLVNITGFNETIKPNIGFYTMAVIDNSNLMNYTTLNNSFNVSALDVKTHSFIVYNYILNITAKNFITNTPIINFTTSINSIGYGDMRVLSTTNGFVEIPVILDTYLVNVTSHGFSPSGTTKTITITRNDNSTFGLFESNTVFFRFFDLETLNLVTDNISIELLGNTITYDGYTINGTKYFDNLNIDTYKVTVNTAAYSPTTIYMTTTGSNNFALDIFLKNGTLTSFIVEDQIGKLQGDVILTFIQTINGSDITIGQIETDFSGRASIYLQDYIEYTLFAVKTGYDTFTGQVTPSEIEYSIIIQQTGTNRYISIFNDLNFETNFYHTPPNTYATNNYILNSALGSLEFYGMSTEYNSLSYFVNTTTIAGGGVESFNITNILPSSFPTVTINYWFKYAGHDLVIWNETYLISNISPENITLENGLFDDLEGLDRTNAIRGIIGALIIILLIVLFSATSRIMTIGLIGGLIGLGINYKYELLPKTLLVVSLVVIFILMISDDMGGKR